MSATRIQRAVDQAARANAYGITGGDPQRGIAAVSKYGCGSCHTIAGNRSAHGLVGPPLTGIGNRMYVAGVLENTPDNIVRWIQHPKAVDDKTVMPDLGVTQQDATDKRPDRTKRSGVKYVHYNQKKDGWVVRVYVNGEMKSIGSRKNLHDAIAAQAAWLKQHKGDR